jgi:uncharacterized protein
MPRPKRRRCIIARPTISAFAPEGTQQRGEAILSLEEFEAIRHIDYEGLDQSQAAEIMDVSRQTFGRILRSARYNFTSALVNGYRLKVEGGCYTLHEHRPGCGQCSHSRRNCKRKRICMGYPECKRK